MTIGYVEVQMHLRDVEAGDIERILRVLHGMGGTYTVLEHTSTRVVEAPPDVPDPAPLPPPEPMWWESLTITIPRTKIYADVEKAQVYFSSGPDDAPSFNNKKLTSTGQLRAVPLGGFVEVWKVPLPLSGWICVAAILSGEALWMRGEDMRATP